MLRLLLILICCCVLNPLQAHPETIILWHSMAGSLGLALQEITNGFNQSQSAYVIKPIYKGDYIESLTSFAAAFRAHQPPDLIQVFEVGTATMLAPEGIIKPVDTIMKAAGLKLPKKSMFPAVLSAYSKDGQLMAMPFNISVPTLFYNTEALAKVGYSAATFPRTWADLEVLASKLKQAGFSCVYTTAYPAWILIESYSAVHDLPMIDSQKQQAIYNHQQIIHHLLRLRRWQGLHYFEYGGRTDDATVLFTSGRCPLLSQSTGAYRSLAELVSFHVGLAPLPMEDSALRRHNNVAGGAALWAVAGKSPSIYQGIALFFKFLADFKVQKRWHEATGYLPLGMRGVYQQLSRERHHSSLELAEQEFMNPTNEAALSNFGPLQQIRAINDEALEAIFSGIQQPKQAMDEAVLRANYALDRFLHNTSKQ